MTRNQVNRWLAGAALALGLLAPLAGTPYRPADGRLDVLTLAEWLRDRRGVTLVDLRDADAFEAFKLPRARRVSPDSLAHLAAPGDTLVLYDAGDGAARALRAPLTDVGGAVFYLEDAVADWVRTILNPALPPDATAEERAAFERVAELSRYFGGMPRVGLPLKGVTDTLLNRTIRRGCAF